MKKSTRQYSKRERILYAAMSIDEPFTSRQVREAIVDTGYKYAPTLQSVSKHLKERYVHKNGRWHRKDIEV